MYTALGFFVLLCALSLVAAGSDVARRTIPNWLNLLVLLSGVAVMVFDPQAGTMLSHLGHFAIALVVSMVLFRFGLWGGGDAKFYSAVALWFPLEIGGALALITALAGLVLVIVSFVAHKLRRQSGKMGMLPYGVAIAVGAVTLKGMSVLP